MTLKLGTLSVDIGGDTKQLETAEKKAKQIYNKIEVSAKGAETASSKSFDAVIDKSGDLSKSQKDVEKSSGAASRGVGQLGIQLGQFAGQVQGGQSALLAFSQQSADILFVLGQMFPMLAGIGGIAGGIIAIGSAIAGSLLPHLFKSKDAVGQLEEAMKGLGEVARMVGDDDIVVLTEKVAKLAKTSEAAAKSMLVGGIDEAMKAISESSSLAREEMERLFGSRILADPGRTAKAIEIHWKELNKFAKAFDTTTDEANSLNAALVEMRRNGDMSAVQQALDEIAATGNRKIAAAAGSLRGFTEQGDEARKKMEALRGFLKDLPSAQVKTEVLTGAKSSGSIEDIERLGETERQAIQREFEEREALILANTQITGDKQTELLGKIAADRSEKLAEISAKEAAAEQAEVDAKQRKIDKILALDESETDRIMRQFYERKDWILSETQLSEDELSALMVAARNKRDADLQKIRDRELGEERRQSQELQREFQKRVSGLQSVATSIGQISAASGKEGAERIAGTISALANSVATIVSLMQVSSTAQGMGDASAPTLQQKIANVATITSIFAGLVGSISNIKKGGGRAFGGQTSGNMMHEFNERGPETLEVGSRQYLLPTGKNGRITPMQEAKGSGYSAPNITVINNAAGVEVTPKQISRDEIAIYVDSKVAEINKSLSSGRGDTATALQQGFNATRKLR